MAQPDQPLSPLWWVKRLYAQLKRQRETFDLFDAYYCGKPARLPWLAEQARDEFRRLLSLSNSNYMGLVVDAMVERQIVEGFRIGKNLAADMPTWDIWQANNLDASSDQVLLEAAIGGCSFLLVAPPEAGAEYPLIYAEHPTQATVDYEPGSGRRRRAAGLKVWLDDWSGLRMATLYLPDAIFKFQAPAPNVGGDTGEPRWEPREVRGELWPAPNPLSEVPLVEVTNNPRMLTGGVSELADVISIQDRVNKTLADRLVTQDFGAFPQKWAKGFPEFDADGNPNRIDVGRDRMVTSDAAETAFGQWDAAPLDPYSSAKREDVKDIASRTRTPAQYLLGEMSNVNGETLKASESGLVSKVRQRNRTSGEGLEDGMRLARKAMGLPVIETIETKWRNPEFRTEGELVDSLIKMATIGVPHEALWERWGASEMEIARWKQQAADQAQLDPIGAFTRAAGQAVPGEPQPAEPPA